MTTCVLIDGDNISAKYFSQVMAIVRNHGGAAIKRVYANAQMPSEWHEHPEIRFIHAGSGKNATDILLSVDAMELLLTGQAKKFLIASSDADFRHLALRIREYNATVIGLGEDKSPVTFRKSCDEFIVVGPAKSAIAEKQTQVLAVPPVSKAQPIPPERLFSDIDLKIKAIIQAESENGQGVKITGVSAKMHTLHQIHLADIHAKNWRTYFTARPHLYALDPKGPEAKVRFIPKGFSISA